MSQSTFRHLDEQEQARLTCSTHGCEEAAQWMQTVRWSQGIGFYACCQRCKAGIQAGTQAHLWDGTAKEGR